MAVKRSPVVGAVVSGEPRAEVAANSSVSTVSVFEQREPTTKTPEAHSTTITGVPIKTVPERSTAAGRRIEWSAKSVTSKPFRPPEPWMKTETLSCVPTAPVRDAGLSGQEVAPD
jgi:hypothetical protein